MLFDKSEFLDLLPRKTLRQQLAGSRPFRLLVELLLVCLMAWLLWFALVRIRLPVEVGQAYRSYDQAMTSRDALRALSLFPSDVTIRVDGGDVSLADFSDRLTAFLKASEIDSINQSTEVLWARESAENELEVRAVQKQVIERPGRPTQHRRLGLTMVWRLTAAGWRLKSMTSKGLRPR